MPKEIEEALGRFEAAARDQEGVVEAGIALESAILAYGDAEYERGYGAGVNSEINKGTSPAPSEPESVGTTTGPPGVSYPTSQEADHE